VPGRNEAMPSLTPIGDVALINPILEIATWRLGAEGAAELKEFFRHYYAGVAPHEVLDHTADTLFGLAYAHYKAADARKPQTTAVRVYNPRLDDHGWHCEYTVVEIVADDMPFIVDSVTAEINARDLSVHRILHPIFDVARDENGRIVRIGPPGDVADPTGRESIMHLQITPQPEETHASLRQAIADVLEDVRAAVADWRSMQERLRKIITTLNGKGDGETGDDQEETKAFLEWLHDNFTFLGIREYRFVTTNGQRQVEVVADSALGLLRDPDYLVFEDLKEAAPIPPAVQGFLDRPGSLMVAKGNVVSTVHRRVHVDVIAIKSFGPSGEAVGEHVLIGLFSSTAYNRSARSIPWLRRKLENVIARANFDPRGHDGRALANIIENFPRDELFQVSVDHLLDTSLGILRLQHHHRVALFLRRDDFERFISCLVYVPRDRYTTELRFKIQEILERAFAGEVTAHYGQVGDSPLARLQVYVKTTPGGIPDYDVQTLQAAIVDAARTWSDELEEALDTAHGKEEGLRLFRRYGHAFPPGYRDRCSVAEAVSDIERIETTLADGDIHMSLYRPIGVAQVDLRFKVFHPDKPLVLSHVLPFLEHLGLEVIDEIPHEIDVAADHQRRVMLHDFGLNSRAGMPADISSVRDHFQDAFHHVFHGVIESDPLNSLVLSAGMRWRQVVIVRAYGAYLRQAGTRFSVAYMQQVLAANPGITRLLVELFRAMFDPAEDDGRDARVEAVLGAVSAALDVVTSADDDRILRRFLNAIQSTLRTNYFQRAADGGPKPYVSFKLDSQKIDLLPAPRPMVEVFVYAPDVEGVHLRGGRVARGGIRWSDRREDFRTEVLGLMKAQMVKNAVIVPVGAKGGFIVKRSVDASDREAFMAAGIACYQTLIRGLLDITDNLSAGEVVAPPEVVRRDDDDPYLVVAADKGTATFSDIANGVAAEYGFWLGDAFASGGSQGYDHKKMGITARGAWESVKRHFRELGTDIQREPFTVVGVGDMSGDVFGNGMLLSPCIRLVAAFDHRHIFIDPEPDCERSLAERQRLFDRSRSSWQDYDPSLLSAGGGIFARSAKVVTLSPEIRARFGITAQRLTPNELIRALLTAEVDLLWFGGIGTYVKSHGESDADVGDRANDAVRVNGADLRCKVVGEGANLGLTQLGRIEYAHKGGRANADFIDNSAGVDCSDHEVNIKILIDTAVADGDVTVKQRNALLTQMTEEVASLVLRDNYLQTQAISQIEAAGAAALDNQIRLMRMLERNGLLDRQVEFLPDDEGLSARTQARVGLTRPEIAILFSYCKIWLYDTIIQSDLPDDRHLSDDLVRYFPTPIGERLRDRVSSHRLRRELVATSLTNSLINRVGGTFVSEIMEKTAMPAVDIARAYIIARDVYSVRAIWEAIEALDNVVASGVQTLLHGEVQRLIERGTIWFLRQGGSPLDITVNITAFDTAVSGLAEHIADVLPTDVNERILARAGDYREDGVPDELAERIAYLTVMPSACDIIRLSAARGVEPGRVARLYFALGEQLGFGWLRDRSEALTAETYWSRLAIAAVIEELYSHQRDITRGVMDTTGSVELDAIDDWMAAKGALVERTRGLVAELRAVSAVDLPMLAVASRQLRALCDG